MKEKVLFVGLVDMNEVKGDSNHFRRLTTFMDNYFDVFVISFTKSENKKYSKINFPANKLLRVLYWNSIIFYLIFKHRLFYNVKKIYFRESGLVISPYIASFLFGIKLYVEINGVNIDDLPVSKKVSLPLFKFVYKFSKKFVASKGYGRLIHFNFDIPNSKIHTVSLGFDFLPQNFSVDDDKFYEKTIVFIGNVIEYQGLDLFLDGFNFYLRNNDDTVKLLIIGEGSQKDYLVNKVEQLGISKNVTFLSQKTQSALASILKKCHLGISVFSQNRGRRKTISALKTYDYINASLPILTSDMDEMSDFIVSNNIGKVIYDYVPEEYAAKIDGCLNDDFILNSQAAYASSIDKWGVKFSWEARFESIKKVILEDV